MLISTFLRRGALIASALLAVSLSLSPSDAAIGTVAKSSNVGNKMKARAEFMRAMAGSSAATAHQLKNGKARRSRKAAANLRKKLLSKARPMPESMKAERAAATLASQVEANAAADQLFPLDTGRRKLDDEDDYGFDVTQYSFKYSGCSAVATYSDEMAEDEDFGSVVITKRFVVFRFCPAEYCADDYKYGCQSGYGEYVLGMDDYLDIMAQYQEEAMERYCDYCEECMNYEPDEEDEPEEEEEEEEVDEDGAGEDVEDDGDGQNRKRRRLDDAQQDNDNADNADGADDIEEDGNDDANANANAQNYCADYDVCYNYADVCDDGNQDDDAVDYKDYFECRQVENNNNNGNNGNGNEYYIGPHCAYDKMTITIALYKDEYCSEYVGNDVDMANYVGFYVDDEALAAYYNEDCITCNARNLPYQKADDNQDDNGDGDAEITELCEKLFDEAGKCHIYMEDVDEDAYGYNQAENEDTVCGFIQNIVTGQYDEYGYIYLNADDYSKGNRNNKYASLTSEISIGQIFGLLISILACVILVIWACFLHRKLTRRAPWRPRKAGESNVKAGKLSRNNSGILLGRSRSGGSYHGGQLA